MKDRLPASLDRSTKIEQRSSSPHNGENEKVRREQLTEKAEN